MRIAHNEDELRNFFPLAKSEALSAFVMTIYISKICRKPKTYRISNPCR